MKATPLPLAPRFARAGAALVLALALGIPAADGERAQVQRALDGDSLRLRDGREIRLIGINTPEFGRDGEPDGPLAAAARQRTAGLTQGQFVRLSYDVERFDRYGRTLAYVVLADGRDLQEILLREGLAWFVAIAPNVARLSHYRAAEAQARHTGRGIWGLDAYAPVAVERLSRNHTSFQRITGTVHAVRHVGGRVMLRLSDRVSLTLAAADFSWPPASLVGRRVLARGWLREYKNGLLMRITHPAMLELL